MALFMSDAELLAGMQEMADRGELVQTGWAGYRAVLAQAQGRELTPEQENLAHWSYWTGARAVFDSLHRLGLLDKSTDPLVRERLAKLMRELGPDPFCRPPKRETRQ